MKVIIFIRDIFRKYPGLLAMNTALVILVSFVEACSLFTVGPLVDFLIHPDLQGVSSLTERVMSVMSFVGLPLTQTSYLIIFVVFIILSSGFRIFARYSILKTKYVVLRELMCGTFEDFFCSRWYFFSSNKQGTLLNTFMKEFTVVGDAFGSIALLFAGFLQLVVYLLIPFYISWQVTIISLAVAVLFVVPFILLGKISYRLGKANVSTDNKLGAAIQESFSLAKVILGYGNQADSCRHFGKIFDMHRRITIKSQTINIAIPTMYQPFSIAVVIIALFVAQKFGISLSEMTILLLALLRAVFTIGNLASYKNSVENFFPSYEQINSLRHEAKQLRQCSGDKKFEGFHREINIRGISFSYPGHSLVLEDINMTIPKGEMIAVVGESGAGKSTLIDMLMGFNEPVKGTISFDDTNFIELDINSYRKRIGYVPQDSVLFNMSIRDNLLWANEKAGEGDIRHACQQAHADEFIEKFPQGYNTLVGDRGVRLSGGQRQRIALARAILRQPEILFLDEATSSLDTYSERLIQQAIEDIAKETTMIIIAHRLSTIINADYVYVLKEGRVIEGGRYSELLNAEGYFKRMVNLQLVEAGKN